jgi:hypothetical protein
MRSRAARLALTALACAALSVASVLTLRLEEQTAERRDAVRAFDDLAAEAAAGLVEARAAQQSYVVPGQGVAASSRKVALLLDQTTTAIDALRGSASSAEAERLLTDALDRITALNDADRRVRDYLQARDQLMAADVLATEAAETAAIAVRRVVEARSAEHLQLDSLAAETRWQQAYALGGGAAVTLLVLGWLALAASPTPAAASPEMGTRAAGSALAVAQAPAEDSADPPGEPSNDPGRFDTLKLAAELCTELGRVNSSSDLTNLLGRAADALDAKGLVVWVSDPLGSPDLRPVLAHGYPHDALSRMATVPRSADNAVAAAYRTGSLQIVLARPGLAHGAIVAPLLAPGGCVGALTAEIRGGSETSDAVQALASLFAAQLTFVVGESASSELPAEGRVASA